jgi:CheY-like chemotaxis protein
VAGGRRSRFGPHPAENGEFATNQLGSIDVGSVAGASFGGYVKRTLVVDDDPLVCSAIRAWLEDRGFAVVVADGGDTGLNALDGAIFDLMIVDIFMHHMHGFESVRVFHQRAPTIPLIAISGYVFAEQRMPAPDFLSMALELGADRCLRKPFTPKTLLSVIDMCLMESEALKMKIIGR